MPSRVVLSPHLDDAVWDAWRAIRDAEDSLVVTVFAGVPAERPVTPWDAICGARTTVSHMADRLAEDRDALAAAGRPGRTLDLLDAQYRDEPPTLDAMLDELRPHVPDGCVVYAPAALGLHVDHVLVRDAAHRLWTRGHELVLYADMPYAVKYGWPAWVTGEPADPHRDPEAYWRDCFRDAPWPATELAVRGVVLEADDAAAKLDAMKRYRTQFPATNGGCLGWMEDPRFHGFEVYWDVARMPASGMRVALVQDGAEATRLSIADVFEFVRQTCDAVGPGIELTAYADERVEPLLRGDVDDDVACIVLASNALRSSAVAAAARRHRDELRRFVAAAAASWCCTST